jgi:putative N-acetyltransferase (TIGR04045 family)
VAVSSSARSVLPEHRERLALGCRIARGPLELERHFAIRRRVFVDAQGLFERDDRDGRDEHPTTLHVVGLAGHDIVGAVRLYALDGDGDGDGLWKGDRLAVLPSERALQLGPQLVRFAVRTAGERGGRRMVAQVQVTNVRFFERLGWRCDGEPAPAFGVAHQPMAIELNPGR